MKIKKKFKIYKICGVFFFMVLNHCVPASTSFLGPAVTVAKTGNIYQAGFSYASNNVIKDQLGKAPMAYVKDALYSNSINNKKSLLASKKHLNNFKFSTDNENLTNNHNDFVIAVKKMLK